MKESLAESMGFSQTLKDSRKRRENSMEKNLQAYNHSRKLAEWAQRVQSCRESGLSVRQWCDENGLSAKTYYYWQRRLFQMSEAAGPRFAKIEAPVHTAGHIAASVRIGTAQAEIYNGADAETLKALVEAMQSC